MTAATETESPAAGDGPLRIAMIGLRGIPATYGGVERAVEELSAVLVDRGHKVVVFARQAYSESAISSHRGVEIVHLKQVNTKHLEAITHTAWSLVVALSSRQFDVIHFHATGPGLLSWIPRLFRVPSVVTVQGLDWRREKWGTVARTVLRFAARGSVFFPSRTIVVSRELQRHFADEMGQGTAYIPNGVHVDDYEVPSTPMLGLEPGRFVLFLGRLVPEKHVTTLVEAYRGVDTDVPLVIAGPSSHSPEYVEKVKRLSAQDNRVQFVGPRYDMEKWWLMRHCLAFVQPSSIEGLPIALLEALAVGAFPVVSNIPENLEPVTVDGETLGFNVPPGDVGALTRALGDALAQPEERRAAAGTRLRQRVLTEYDWRAIGAATEELYRGIVR